MLRSAVAGADGRRPGFAGMGDQTMTDGKKPAPHHAAEGKAAARPAISLDRSKLIGGESRTTLAKIGDSKGGGGGGGGGGAFRPADSSDKG
jgi:hypothetical protein